MDNRLLILAMVLVVLLIGFGKNPTIRHKQEVFEQSLQERLNKKDVSVSDMFSASGTSMKQNGGASNPFAPNSNSTGFNPNGGGTPMNPAMQNANGGSPMRLPTPAGNAPNAVAPNMSPSNIPPTQPPAPPPAFTGGLVSQPNPDVQRQVATQAGGGQQAPAFFLKDGRRVFFSGYTVFIMGTDGSLAPLPDGRYTMQSGDPIVVRDGKRVSE